MLTVNLRIGIAEIALAISLVLVLALVALFVIEWPIGLIPAASYAVATVGTYAGYRVHSREQVYLPSRAQHRRRDRRQRVRLG